MNSDIPIVVHCSRFKVGLIALFIFLDIVNESTNSSLAVGGFIFQENDSLVALTLNLESE